MNIEVKTWGKTPDHKDIKLYTLTNANGVKVQLSDIGAGIVSIVTPDRYGHMEDIVLGYPHPWDYYNDGPCAGKTPGRFANRIANGRFTLEDKEYQLELNTSDGKHHLHGGSEAASASPTRNGPAASMARAWCSLTSVPTERQAIPPSW